MSDFSLAGDFEVSFDFKVDRIGDADGNSPFEANAEVSLYGNSRFSIYGINVNNDPKGRTYKVVRFEPTLTGTHFNLISFPRTSDQGRIHLRRVGTELVFLVSEKPEETPVELVRLPYGGNEEPRLRLSAYQGTGTRPMEVDVLFDSVSIKGAIPSPVRPQPLPPPGVNLQPSFPINLDYTGKANHLLSQWRNSNDQGPALMVENGELRVRPPHPTQPGSANSQTYWYRESEFTLEGNFRVSAHYDNTSLEPHPKLGYGSVNVGIGLETNKPQGSITFGRGAERGSGQRFRITRYHPTKAGRHWDTLSFPAKTAKGTLILQKHGETLMFLVQEEGGTEVELFRCPAIQAAPVRLRVSVDQGGTPEGKVDLLLSGIRVEADSLGIQGNRSPVLPIGGPLPVTGSEATPDFDTKTPRLKIVAILATGIALSLGLALIWNFRRSATNETTRLPTKPSSPESRSPKGPAVTRGASRPETSSKPALIPKEMENQTAGPTPPGRFPPKPGN